jgi:protein gp37
LNCYVYRMDERHGRISSAPVKTQQFGAPVRKKRDGSYLIDPGSFVWTCFTSDFLLEQADPWREEAWAMMRERQDLTFLFITKRIHRFIKCIPKDWGDGYANVRICCTVENQKRADERLPIFEKVPAKHKSIICEPLLEKIDLSPYLGPWVREVTVGGESGSDARVCDYRWVIDLQDQCAQKKIPFIFKQTGYRFLRDGKLYLVARRFQHEQAQKAGLNTGEIQAYL